MSENPRKIALFLPLPHGLTQLGVVLVITCDKCRLFYNTQKLSTKVGQRVASAPSVSSSSSSSSAPSQAASGVSQTSQDSQKSADKSEDESS